MRAKKAWYFLLLNLRLIRANDQDKWSYDISSTHAISAQQCTYAMIHSAWSFFFNYTSNDWSTRDDMGIEEKNKDNFTIFRSKSRNNTANDHKHY